MDSTLWVTNGTVNTVVRDGGTVYIGGSFDYVGPPTGGAVPISAATGGLPPWYPKVEGVVLAVIPDGSGGWYLGGLFSAVGGLPRSNLARLASDLSVMAWNPGANDVVFDLALSGSVVYAGGVFTSAGGQPRSRIAALDVTTGAATSWNPNANSDVYTLAVSGGTVYVGGGFSSIGGQARSGIAALSVATGTATAWNPSASAGGAVQTLAISSSTIYAGGAFSSIGGQVRNNLAALDATSGLATSWNPNCSGPVSALALSGNTLYVGGTFSTIGGQSRNNLAAIATSNGNATNWNPNADNMVSVLALSGSTVYAGGDFRNIGGQPRNRLAALDGGGLATAWNPNVSKGVRALSLAGGTVYAGGDFGSIGGQNRSNLAALDAVTGAAKTWNPGADGVVKALVVAGTKVYAGGGFGTIGGQSRAGIAELDVNGSATPWNPNANGEVRALLAIGTTVYAGGSFSNLGGATRLNLAGLDAASGTATSWGAWADGPVDALATDGATIYVGGEFSHVTLYARANLAAVDATFGSVLGWDPGANGAVRALLLDGSTLYAGGSFTVLGGVGQSDLGAVDAVTGTPTGWNPGCNGTVNALAMSGTTVYAGGEFSTVGIQPRSSIAAMDATSGAVLPWNPGTSFFVNALTAAGGEIYVGGNFGSIGGLRRPGLGGILAAPDLQGLSPTSGGNNGTVTLILSGHNLRAGCAAKLQKAGQSDIPGSGITVAADGASVSATFVLSDKPLGAWNVVVTNPDQQSATLPNAFTIQAGTAPQLRVSVLGPEPIRADYPTAFDLVIENPGNVDALAVPLWLTGIPLGTTVTPGFTVTAPPQAPGEPAWGSVPLTFTSAAGQYLPLVIPRLPPGTTTRRIVLSVPSSAPLVQLGAAVAPSWSDDPVFKSCLSGAEVIGNPACVGPQLTVINAYLAAHPEVEAMSGAGIWAKVAWQCEGATTLAAAIAKSEQVLDALDGPVEQGTAASGCGDVFLPRWREVVAVNVVFSIDPNDKLGPAGTVSSQQAIPYSIRFENLSTATAWTRQVVVVDPLPTSLDLSTLSLDAINLFGTVRLLPAPGSKQYTYDVDLGHDNLIVRVSAILDVPSRQLTWLFSTLDKGTLQPPANALLGFLPPNQNPPQGEGSVLFTIRPSAQVANGTQIQNQATITFDGSSLTTPVVSNALDNVPPSSNVMALGTPISNPSFTVNWTGTSASGDLKDYTIYVAEDAAPYQVWKQNTLTTSDLFTPRPGGHNYSFFSVARDLSGNIEPAPVGPDAQTLSTTAVGSGVSSGLTLLGGQPNPAQGVLRVGFALASRAPARMELIDVAGRRLLVRQVGGLGPGNHVVTLDSPALKSGLYFVRLVQEGRSLETPVVLMK